MKKIILAVVAVFAFSFANAQETKFGAKVALNIATLTGDAEDVSSIVGFQIGGFAEFKISDKFSIQPELLFSTQGAQVQSEGDEVDFNLSYLNIPVMAKYYATPKLSFELGPQIGFLTSAKGKTMGVSVDIDDFFKSTDFGLNFGAGYDFTNKFSAGVRYNLGLSNIAEDSGDESIQNSVFSISLGYKFN
jgi:hypothetical protein